MKFNEIRNTLALSSGKAELLIDGERIPVIMSSVDVNYNPYSQEIKIECVAQQFVEVKKAERIPRLGIKNVIFNDPATIVLWNDGTKTVVKCQNDEPFDAEKGLALAIIKRKLGNKGNYFNQIKQWTEKYNLKEEAAKRQTVNDILENLYNCLTKPSTETKDDTNA